MSHTHWLKDSKLTLLPTSAATEEWVGTIQLSYIAIIHVDICWKINQLPKCESQNRNCILVQIHISIKW